MSPARPRASVVAVAVAPLVRARERLAQRVGVERRRAPSGAAPPRRPARRTGRGSAARSARARARAARAERRAGLARSARSRSRAAGARPSSESPREHARVRAASRRGAAAARPSAQSTPEARGQSMRAMPSSLGERGRVQRAGAAERHQREAARVDPALDASSRAARPASPPRPRARSPPRSASQLEAELAREAARSARSAAPRSSDSPPASGESSSRRPSSRLASVTVGCCAAAPVAGGPGRGARRGGPDAQRAAGVAPGDRAAAGADRVDVERRQRQRPSGDRALGGLARPAPPSIRQTSQEVPPMSKQSTSRLAGELGQQQRAADAAGRAREHRQRGVRARRARVGQPARGLHDLRLGQAQRARASRDEPRAGRRPSSGESAASSTVVAVRSYSRKVPTSSLESETCDAGQQLREQLAEQPLVRGVGVGVQQRRPPPPAARRCASCLDQRRARAPDRARAAGRPGPMRSGTAEAQLGGRPAARARPAHSR